MRNLIVKENEILISRQGELIRVSSCGKNAIRFQSFPDCQVIDENYTLMPQKTPAKIVETDTFVTITNGTISATVNHLGKVEFCIGDKTVLREKSLHTFDGNGGYRKIVNIGAGNWQVGVTFEPNKNERFFGLGHSWDNEFDLKGSTIDLCHLNAKCTIPYVYSSLGYGFIWNNPSPGLCELSNNKTRWTSNNARFIDYVVIAGTPKETSTTLADLTGYAPKMPQWATGFWQSRLRYESQEELLSVARKYKELGIPLSAIIVDYFHWTEQGDYKFDSKYWPNVREMADEIHSYNTKLLVSMWPTINEKSENYRFMSDNNMLMRTMRGSDRVFQFYGWQAQIDVTNPDARQFIWSKLKENYVDNGVDAFWFDVAEPEISPSHFDNIIMHKGRGDMIALLYPYYYSKLVYDGFKSIGKEEIISLNRCAYLGCQKFGTLVWSGDIESSFESLAHQVKAAMNMAMCGIPWWNTDIGGFYGGDTTSEYFRELIVRWFQFGLFSPVMRIHGSRILHGKRSEVNEPSGDPNEIWSFGEENFIRLKRLIMIREKLRPYIQKQFDTASEKGYPLIRPMFFEYPNDEICYTLDSQYMFGDDIIFAPIVNQGQTVKSIYIPDGEWVLTKNNAVYTKGFYEITANLDEFVAFVKKGSPVIDCFK